MLERLKKAAAVLTAASLVIFAAACGGAEKTRGGSIAVTADSQFEAPLNELAQKLKASRGITVEFTFADTPQVYENTLAGKPADLILLRGATPMDKLVKARVIDNYAVFASHETALGTERCTMAKPLSGRRSAAAQAFADLIASAGGRAAFAAAGFGGA